MILEKKQKRYRRHERVKGKIMGKALPRLYVFRSNKHIYAQIIDKNNHTLVSASDLDLKKTTKERKTSLKSENLANQELKESKEKISMAGKVKIAFEVGKLIAEASLKEKIGNVVFDRAGYRYHGRVKSLAEGAREGGLKF